MTPARGGADFYNLPMSRHTYTRAAGLPALLQQRIAIIDGAMGTMIQRHKPTEETYRGERFADWRQDVKGNNELCLNEATMIEAVQFWLQSVMAEGKAPKVTGIQMDGQAGSKTFVVRVSGATE